LPAKGYFDSQFNKSQLGVSLDRHQAFWDIDYDSGERYRFGPSRLKARKFAKNICKTWCRLKGRLLQSQDLAELNRRLAATGWFNSVVVAPSLISPAKPKCCLCRALSRRAKRTPLKPGSAIQPTSGRA
jgi:translocation and assembly module TamA